MRLIGITGSSGSGKSTVADYFSTQGYTVIDGDAISKELALPGSAYVRTLQNEFGWDICDEKGALMRRVMADRAFSTIEGQKRLTCVTTPLIMEEVRRRIEQCKVKGETLAFLDGAVILDTPFQKLCDQVIAVLAEPEAQLARIAARDAISMEAARARLSRQWNNEKLQQRADLCIYNTSNKEELLCTAKNVLNMLKNNV